MTNKQITDQVILKQILKEPDPKKREHALDVFHYNQCTERERERVMAENRAKMRR